MTTTMMRLAKKKMRHHHHHHSHYRHASTTTSSNLQSCSHYGHIGSFYFHHHDRNAKDAMLKKKNIIPKPSFQTTSSFSSTSLNGSSSSSSSSQSDYGSSSSTLKYFSSVTQQQEEEDDDDDDVDEVTTKEEEVNKKTFPPTTAPSANPVFYRAYSRRMYNSSDTAIFRRETFHETIHRTILNLSQIGSLTPTQTTLILNSTLSHKTFPSGRALWVAGTPWSSNPNNVSGYYNCTSLNVNNLEAFGLLMDLSMMGCGTGAVLEQNDECLGNLPVVMRRIDLRSVTPIGGKGDYEDDGRREEFTSLTWNEDTEEFWLRVGDSRKGWVDAYMTLLELSFSSIHDDNNNNDDGDTCTTTRTKKALQNAKLPNNNTPIQLNIDLSNIRPPGTPLKGFGGTANPTLLPQMFTRVTNLLNSSLHKPLSSIDACLLIDECASAVVAGNIRRSAGMRQFDFKDEEAAHAKANLYRFNEETQTWSVDSKRESLRLANHTRVVHCKPTLEEVRESVRMQFETGEGAIQYAPEAIVRANADLFLQEEEEGTATRQAFLKSYQEGGYQKAAQWLKTHKHIHDKQEIQHRLRRYGLNPCGEIIGCDFHCNLSEVHLNTLEPSDIESQKEAFQAAALTASCLLHQTFPVERFQYSRSIDPIIGVSFTGLFDFFVKAFGKDWLQWMMEGRSSTSPFAKYFEEEEALYLQSWRDAARNTVVEYCKSHGLGRVPSRITTVQPAGTKSLLTGASPGWHPPKATRFVRRVTFARDDPIALACMDYGYSVIPAPSARDEVTGELLDDIYDERSTEWLVEIPTEVSWANLIDGDDDDTNEREGGIDLSQMPARSQWGLYWTVQTNYTDHNTSATIEFREDEIDELSQLIHDGIGHGYVSAALLARFDSSVTFPRMPMEPISRDRYCEMMEEVESRRISNDFDELVARRDEEVAIMKEQQRYRRIIGGGDAGDAACTSEACLSKVEEMERRGLS